METSQIALNQGLAFLAWATGVIVIVLGACIVKLAIDSSGLIKNLKETSNIINTELKPTLQNVNETLTSINGIIKNTDKGVGDVKSAIGKIVDKTKSFSGTLLGGLLNGFMTVYKMLKK